MFGTCTVPVNNWTADLHLFCKVVALASLNILSVLRIRDVYAGSDYFHPGSRTQSWHWQDPGSGSASKNLIIFNPENLKLGGQKLQTLMRIWKVSLRHMKYEIVYFRFYCGTVLVCIKYAIGFSVFYMSESRQPRNGKNLRIRIRGTTKIKNSDRSWRTRISGSWDELPRPQEEQANRVTSCIHITRIILRVIRRKLLCKKCEHIPGSHLPETEGETRGPHGSRTTHIRRNCFRRPGFPPPPPHLSYTGSFSLQSVKNLRKPKIFSARQHCDLTLRSALTGLVIVHLHIF
jgi:hypothetical protein